MRARITSGVVSGTLGWLTLVVLVFILDLYTGPEYGFGFFYLIAVIPAAWLLGRGPGLIVAAASGLAWLSADAAQSRLSTIWPTVWNASSRLLLFVLAAWLLDLVRRERERLRKVDRDRSHFMRVLEHELAGPGHDLAAGLRSLQDGGGATAVQLQPLVERAQDLEFLSRDFVSLGQLQSDELWLQHRAVDIRAIVEELRARATGGPRMPLTLSTAAFNVEGDDARLRQAISSLLAAVRDSAGSSEVTLDLRREGGNAKLTISAGAGPFLAMTSDDLSGVGVELARMIIEGHGGRLDQRREAASKALRFVVMLPLAG